MRTQYRHDCRRTSITPVILAALSGISPWLWVARGLAAPTDGGVAFDRIASTRMCKPPTNPKEFRSFIAKCSNEHLEYRLSLKRLLRDLEACQRSNTSGVKGHQILDMIPRQDRPAVKCSGSRVIGIPPKSSELLYELAPPGLSISAIQRTYSLADCAYEFDAAHFLYGFNYFFGFVITGRGADGDVILLGLRDHTRSPMDVDFVRTAIAVTAQAGVEPACSLDANDDDPNFQKSVVLGVPWESRWAECMLSADYRMKSLAMGYTLDRKVLPYLQRRALTLQKSPRRGKEDGETNRFWFTRSAQDTQPRSLILAQGPDRHTADVLLMTRNPVILLTEKQLNGEFGTGQTSDEAESFARDFTKDLERIGVRFPSIGNLLSAYMLLDVFVHLRAVGKVDIPGEDFWVKRYRTCANAAPRRYRTLSRSLQWGGRRHGYAVRVSGGVRMPLEADASPAVEEQPQDLMRLVLAGWPDTKR